MMLKADNNDYDYDQASVEKAYVTKAIHHPWIKSLSIRSESEVLLQSLD